MDLVLSARLLKDLVTVARAAIVRSPKAMPSEKALCLRSEGSQFILETSSGRVHLKLIVKGLKGKLDRTLIVNASDLHTKLRDNVGKDDNGELVLATSTQLHAEGILNLGAKKIPIESYISSWAKNWLDREEAPAQAQYPLPLMRSLLDFLLLPLPQTLDGEPDYYGIIFQRDEMLSTDMNRLHVQTQLPPLCEEPRLVDARGFHALEHFLRLFPGPWMTTIAYHKKPGFFSISCGGADMSTEVELEMQVYESQVVPDVDDLRRQLGALPQSFSVVVSTTEILKTLAEARGVKDIQPDTGLELHLGEAGGQWWLRYCIPEEDYAKLEDSICGQTIAWMQQAPPGPIGLTVDARYFKELISPMGTWVRLFFQDAGASSWTPIYADGWGPDAPAGRFGILAPMTGVYYPQAAQGGSP